MESSSGRLHRKPDPCRLFAMNDSAKRTATTMNARLVGLTLILATASLHADTIVFKGGALISGIVLQTNDKSVFVRRDYGTFNYPVEVVQEIKRDAATFTKAKTNTAISPSSRIVANLTRQSWAYGVRQVPATAAETGIFKNVPYASYRAGSNYELNVYGDPENPAGVEMGVYGALTTDGVAKNNCIEFVASVLTDLADKEVVRKLNRETDVSARERLVFEVTPPTAIDAEGAWWISVYDEDKLQAARAATNSPAGADSNGIPASLVNFDPNDSKWLVSDKKEIAKAVPPGPGVTNSISAPGKRTPVTVAKPATSKTVSSSKTESNASTTASATDAKSPEAGVIQIKGYYRKDGTYVRPHTRKVKTN